MGSSSVETRLAGLRDRTTASIESSSAHHDVIRDLKRINAHVVALAHPILERQGALGSMRLRAAS